MQMSDKVTTTRDSETSIRCLRFGIPDLDVLLRWSSSGPEQPNGLFYAANTTTSLSLVGPDGSGKTLLALHLAARYLHDAGLEIHIGRPAGRSVNRHEGICFKLRGRTRSESDMTELTNPENIPRIIYASVDFTLEKARETWEHFFLHNLKDRDKALYQHPGWKDDPKLRLIAPALNTEQVKLEDLPDEAKLVQFIKNGRTDDGKLAVGFLDLQPRTAGDPWNYLRRILNLMSTASQGQAPAMLIVDSTDALFTLSGGIDAYGEQRNRESRVSQLLGAARDTAHLVMLVGASDPEERPTESYLTDAVVRIRVTDESHYQVRSVEIEKVRAQNSVRGRHRFGVRSGEGSSTGRQQNADDPSYRLGLTSDNESDQDQPKPLAHIKLFHSIDFLDSYERAVSDVSRSEGERDVKPFTGIEYLDSMLPVRDAPISGMMRASSENHRSRLQLGTVSAIIGSAKTFKSNIGRAFLARGVFDAVLDQGDLGKMERWIAELAEQVGNEMAFLGPKEGWTQDRNVNWIAELGGPMSDVAGCNSRSKENEILCESYQKGYKAIEYEKLISLLRLSSESIALRQGPILDKPGFGILLTTDDLRPERLAERLAEWAIPHSPPDWARASSRPTTIQEQIKRRVLHDWIESRLICRRLEAHTIYPETLIHIVLRCIFDARRVLGIPGDDTASTRKESGRIRLMIDDWSTICQMYPTIGRDSKCLQFLIREARRLGVTTFIVNSQPLSPGQLLSAGTGANLASESDIVFTTWPVAFRGSRLAAVCVGETARMSEPTIVREIRNRRNSNELILVDPHLELYRGLLREESEPEPVPLRVCLLGEKHAGTDYLSRIGSLFGEMFAAIPGKNRSVVETVVSRLDVESSYEQLRALCYFQTGSLDHTLIMLVDEFWGVRTHRSFLSMQDYFNTETACGDIEVRDLRDPHELFRRRLGDTNANRRIDFFDTSLFDQPYLPGEYFRPQGSLEEAYRSHEDKPGMFRDRVPYSWDYAFLACRLRAWENGQSRRVKVWNAELGRRVALSVGDVWKALADGASPLVPLHKDDLTHVEAMPGEDDPPKGLLTVKDLRSWRWFLGAAAVVAQSDNFFQTKKVIPFDFHSAGPETLGCWILEVWASEILRSIERNKRWQPDVTSEKEDFAAYHIQCAAFEDWLDGDSSQSTPRQGILEWLGVDTNKGGTPAWLDLKPKEADYAAFLGAGGWSIELYKTLRMLCEFVNEMDWLEEQKPGEFVQHVAAPSAVAVRHYYKTASVAWQNFDHDDPIVPLSLPGQFSTRGDLALTIARGSRSVRLGERSIDKLCSRAGNDIRLETGVGLPVRKMTQPERAALSTRLTAVERFAEEAGSDGQFYPPFYERPLRYEELLRTAPRRHEGEGEESWSGYWLWRSRLYGYDSQCVVWHKWLHSTFVEFLRLRRSRGAVWVESLDAYDQIEQWQCGKLTRKDKDGKETVLTPQLTTYKKFGGWCRELIARLEAATPGGGTSNSYSACDG